jgi:hypothetical protein
MTYCETWSGRVEDAILYLLVLNHMHVFVDCDERVDTYTHLFNNSPDVHMPI